MSHKNSAQRKPREIKYQALINKYIYDSTWEKGPIALKIGRKKKKEKKKKKKKRVIYTTV